MHCESCSSWHGGGRSAEPFISHSVDRRSLWHRRRLGPGTKWPPLSVMECLFNGTISTEFGWRTAAALLIFLLNDETLFTLSTKRLIKLQPVETRNFPLTRVRLIQSHFHFLLQQMKQHEMIFPSKHPAPVFSLVLTLYNTSTQRPVGNEDEWASCLNNIKLWKVKGSLLLLSRLQTGSDADLIERTVSSALRINLWRS